MVDRRIGHLTIQLAVADLGATEAFYAGILEIPISRALTSWGAPEHLAIDYKGSELIFVEETAMIKNHPVLGERLNYPKGVGITLHFRVKEIEDIYGAILEENLEVLYPLEEKPYGVKELWCFDPDSYLVVLEEPWR